MKSGLLLLKHSMIGQMNRNSLHWINEHSTKQLGCPLSTYYGDLIEIFQELDHRDKIVMNNPDDVIAYKKSVERLRVLFFWMD